ncbi:HAD family hydrolase [Flindersiella endophytica]
MTTQLPDLPMNQLPLAAIVNLDATLNAGLDIDEDCLDHCNGTPNDTSRQPGPTNGHIVVVVRALFVVGVKIHLLASTLDETRRSRLETWIDVYLGVPYEALHLRGIGDDSCARSVKSALYVEHIQGRYDVVCVIDHEAADTPMWHGHDLDCLLVRQALPDERGGR